MNVRSLVVAAAVSVSLVACGSPGDHVTFTAPPSYHSAMSLGPFMQMWMNGSSMLSLVAMPVSTDLKNVNQAQASQVQDARNERRSDEQICGGSQAAVVESGDGQTKQGTNGDRKPIHFDFLITNVNGKGYMGMYIRPLAQAADPAAEAAIRNICPK